MLESEKKLVAQRRTRTRYDAAFKLACVEKVIQNPDRTFQSLASEIGIPLNNLYSWYNKYKKEKLNLTSENPPRTANRGTIILCTGNYWSEGKRQD